jgi:hypothetical protein
VGQKHSSVYHEPDTGEGPAVDQRTETTIIGFQGWDLPGPGAGNLEYSEERYRSDRVERASGQAVEPTRSSIDRSCRLRAPVVNARAIFELYEGITNREYGIRISANRRTIDVFMFDEDNFDIELGFVLDAPFPGLPVGEEADGDDRLLLSDAGPRFMNSTATGVPTVTLTRAALLAGLDQQATMEFTNMKIAPVVQRLSAE